MTTALLETAPDTTLVRTRIARNIDRVHPGSHPTIDVAVHEHEVVLTGVVADWEEGWAAEYAAWSTPGVETVSNRLRVRLGR